MTDEQDDGQYKVRSVMVDRANPINDQSLARADEDLRCFLDVTIHPIIDQAEEQDAGLTEMMAAIVTNLVEDEEGFARDRITTLLCLAAFLLAADEREPVGYMRTAKIVKSQGEPD